MLRCRQNVEKPPSLKHHGQNTLHGFQSKANRRFPQSTRLWQMTNFEIEENHNQSADTEKRLQSYFLEKTTPAA